MFRLTNTEKQIFVTRQEVTWTREAQDGHVHFMAVGLLGDDELKDLKVLAVNS